MPTSPSGGGYWPRPVTCGMRWGIDPTMFVGRWGSGIRSRRIGRFAWSIAIATMTTMCCSPCRRSFSAPARPGRTFHSIRTVRFWFRGEAHRRAGSWPHLLRRLINGAVVAGPYGPRVCTVWFAGYRSRTSLAIDKPREVTYTPPTVEPPNAMGIVGRVLNHNLEREAL